MQYLIDTYNLLHAAAGMGGSASDMSVRLLCQHISAAAGMKATLVLDGRPKPDEPSENEFPDIGLVWSGTGVSADLVISQRVERGRHRKKITVVSNDREVILHARRNGASAMSCESFVTLLTGRRHSASAELPSKKVTGTPTKGESELWMKEFGLDAPGAAGIDKPSPKKPQQKTGDEEIDGIDIERLLGPPGDG